MRVGVAGGSLFSLSFIRPPAALLPPARYTSGEYEALDLDEVVREGHMSLLSH